MNTNTNTTYAVLPVKRGGWVVAALMGPRRIRWEYMGRDGYWARSPENATAFDSREDAEAALEALENESE